MVRSASYTPDVGDLVWLSFSPQAGREQAGRRPALVLSPRSYNSSSRLCIVSPITSQTKGYPFEVATPEQIFDFYRARGFSLTRMKTCGGSLGCNEFVFEKNI